MPPKKVGMYPQVESSSAGRPRMFSLSVHGSNPDMPTNLGNRALPEANSPATL